MTTEATDAVYTLPPMGTHPFDPAEELIRLRETDPVTRLGFPDGHLGWLVTKHSIGRRVLSDPRFSARQELVHFPVRLPLSQRPEPAQPGWLVRMDPPDHTRYRRLLTGQFTVHRLKQLQPRIEQITNDHLDAMERAGGPVDLVESFAMPIPSLVICDLLGVSYEDRALFAHHMTTLTALDIEPDDVMAAVTELGTYVYQLVMRKRTEPTDDLLSGLARSDELTDEELTNIAMLLLLIGYETTAHMIAHGIHALLRHPAQLARLRADMSLMENTVHELLRYLSIVETGISRAALEDVELEGRQVRAGETVTVWISTANRDPEVFADPDELDITRRQAAQHMTFSHGIHMCLGQELARLEMRTAYAGLLTRFPGLRLAVEPDSIPLRTGMAVHGVRRLPVIW